MQLAVIGTGYVGLVTGACLAELGHSVTCLDIDKGKIAALQAGEVPIFESGLEELLERNGDTGRIRFTTDYAAAIPGAEAVFVAVGTPSLATGHADLSQVTSAAAALAPHLDRGATVVMKSTVPVGTTRTMQATIQEARPDLAFEVASNPEFLRQGAAVDDFMHPDRIVIGTISERAEATMRRIYHPFVSTGVPMLFMRIEGAELVKYASNAFLAIKLAFVNEIADLCEQVGADIEDVTTGVGLDSRISNRFLAAGPGFGGSCLPKDTQALLHTSQVHGAPSRVVGAAVDANLGRRSGMARKVVTAAGGSLQGKQIAVLGLTFKANTDDLRESPAVDVVRALIGLGAKVRAFDPQGMGQARRILPDVDYASGTYEAIDGADILVILTEWAEFATLDLARVRQALAEPVVVDLRNLYDPAEMAAAGFHYHSIGRPVATPSS